jgi:hemoglobin
MTMTSGRSVVCLILVAMLGCKKDAKAPPSAGPEAPPPAAAGSATAPAPAPAAGKTLFERLGGQPGVDAILEENFKIIQADPRIKARFDTVDVPGLRKTLGVLVCQATKGPCKYDGKSVAESHKGLDIKPAEFDAFAEDFGKALDARGVQKPEKDELFAIFGPLKAEVVGK